MGKQQEKPAFAILIGFMPNPRIMKRLALEKTMGNVHLICWDRMTNMLPEPAEDGYKLHIIRIAASSNPLKRLIPYARFKAKARQKLESIKPTLIHVQGLDMLQIACAYKRLHPHVNIIYEVADLHRLIVDRARNLLRKGVRSYLIFEERRLSRKIDLLIVTSSEYVSRYFGAFVPENKILYMPNVPDLGVFETYVPKSLEEPMTVGYIGAVRYKQQIRNLIAAAKACGMKVMIAGFENEPREIENLCVGDPDIEWVGRFDFQTQAAELYGKCHIMYSVYDADMQNVRVALPNKLYEAVYCQMPLIVARKTYLAQVVEEWGVGVAVDHRTPDELVAVLKRFQTDRAWYEHFGVNGEKYRHEIDLTVYNKKLKGCIKKVLDRQYM